MNKGVVIKIIGKKRISKFIIVNIYTNNKLNGFANILTMKKFCLTLITLFLFACNAKKENLDAKFHYNEALRNIKSTNYYSAKSELETIEKDFPYSDLAVKAEVLNIFLTFLNKDYEDTINLTDKFIKLRPANNLSDYVYFLKANSYLKMMVDYRKDQSYSLESKNNFLKLIARYPDSKYVIYAAKKINLIDENIALYYLELGKTLRKDSNIIGAIDNLNFLNKNYPKSKFINESHYRLAEIYYNINLKQQALSELKYIIRKNKSGIWREKAKKLTQEIKTNAKTNKSK